MQGGALPKQTLRKIPFEMEVALGYKMLTLFTLLTWLPLLTLLTLISVLTLFNQLWSRSYSAYGYIAL